MSDISGPESPDERPEPWAKTRSSGADQVGSDTSLGRLVVECDPLELGVHPAAPVIAKGVLGSAAMPGYVRRPHDGDLGEYVTAALEGRSRIAVLVGSSSTGKTRTCWEAVQPLGEHGWRLWHPFDPTQAEAILLNLERVGPRTVVWLNDAQHCFDAGGGLGERVAAALATLLADRDRAPVLVLATLWPEHADRYMGEAVTAHLDVNPRVRALIENCRIHVPPSFDSSATDAAQALADAGDEQLAAALKRAADGCVTQDLAGGPELVHRYRSARPAARALLQAAMDARRLGIGLHLPLAFLRQAAEDYLSESEFDALPEEWEERALAELASPVYGDLVPLRRIRPRRPRQRSGAPASAAPPPHTQVYRLADYLEQHGLRERATECPPNSFWQAAHDQVTDPGELSQLAQAALCRYRLSWAFQLQRRSGLCPPAGGGVQTHVMRMRATAGDVEGVDALVREEAAAGSVWALLWLAALRESTGDRDAAEWLLRKAADAGHIGALVRLLALRKEAGDIEDVEYFTRAVINARGCRPDLLPQMHLGFHYDQLQGFNRSSRLAPAVSYVWIAPHGPTSWAFSKDGTPIPVEYCASVDGIPLLAAIYSSDPDPGRVLVDRMHGRDTTTWVKYFIARRTVPSYRPGFFGLLEEVREDTRTPAEAQKMVRIAADAGAFPDTFFSDLLESWVDEDNRAWLIDRIVTWWPYGLDPDGTPTLRW